MILRLNGGIHKIVYKVYTKRIPFIKNMVIYGLYE